MSWLRVIDMEWLRQKVPLERWPRDFLERELPPAQVARLYPEPAEDVDIYLATTDGLLDSHPTPCAYTLKATAAERVAHYLTRTPGCTWYPDGRYSRDEEDAEWARLEALGVPPDVIGEAMNDPRYRYGTMPVYQSGCATCDEPDNSTPHLEHSRPRLSEEELAALHGTSVEEYRRCHGIAPDGWPGITLEPPPATGPHPDGDRASPGMPLEGMDRDELDSLVAWAKDHRPDLTEGEVAVLWRAAEHADDALQALVDMMSVLWESEADVLALDVFQVRLLEAAIRTVTQMAESIRDAGITR